MSLDDAMTAVEAALPEGWTFSKLHHWRARPEFKTPTPENWVAEAYRTGPEISEPGSNCRVEASTAEEALNGLADRLTDPSYVWLPRRVWTETLA